MSNQNSDGTPPRRRQRAAGIYVPLHRRNQPESALASATGSPKMKPLVEGLSSIPVRKGRGTFRADFGTETTETTKTVEPRAPRGRDFDATTLRRYNTDSSPLPLRTAQPSDSQIARSTTNPVSGRSTRTSIDDPDEKVTGLLFQRMEVLSQRMTALENPKTSKQISVEVDADPNDQLSEGSGERNDDSEDPTYPSSELADSSFAEDEVEDWETVLDDENAIRKITFTETPKRTTASTVVHDDYPNDDPTTALQVYDFPPAFRTHHIHDIFAEYEDISRGGFQIHWVDDTTCILEFRSASIAKRAYLEKSDHKMVRIKPYTQRLPVNDNHPDRKLRPVTTDAVVRRLVRGALGIRKNTRGDESSRPAELDPLRLAKAQRQAERKKKKQREEELEKAFLEK